MGKGPTMLLTTITKFCTRPPESFLSTNLQFLHSFLTIAFQQKENSSLLQYLLCHSSKCWQQKVFSTCIHILMRYSLSKITSRGIDVQIQKKTEKKTEFSKNFNFVFKVK